MLNETISKMNPILSKFSSQLTVLESAIQQERQSQPKPQELVTALVNLEKQAKKSKDTVSYEQLVGTWRLCFITGTKKVRQRSGVALGAGRYLPPFLKIDLSYNENTEIELDDCKAGKVTNSVNFAGLNLTLSGPTKFFPKQKLLAFDFTQIQLKLLGKKLYSGYIQGGQNREAIFYDQPLKKQAFFRYFIIENNYIAARGRGGGLALWRLQN